MSCKTTMRAKTLYCDNKYDHYYYRCVIINSTIIPLLLLIPFLLITTTVVLVIHILTRVHIYSNVR